MSERRKIQEKVIEEASRSPELLQHLAGPGAQPNRRLRGAEDAGAIAQALMVAAEEFFVFSRSGKVVEVNPHACLQLGFEREELIGVPIWRISGRQTPASFERLVRALDDEGPQFLFGHNERKDGSSYAVEARLWLAPYRDDEHVFALLRDASGSQGLIEERDQLISLIENSSESITVASPEGICSYMNPAGLEMLGLKRVEDIVGRPLWDLHPEEYRAEIEGQILKKVLRGRWRGEVVYKNQRTGTDTPCWVNAFAIQHSQSKDLIGIAVVSHDISERKAAERHRERLLELNQVSRQVATSLLQGGDLNAAVQIILSGVGRILDVSRAFLCRYREDRSKVVRTHQWTAVDGRTTAIEPVSEPSGRYSWATDILVRGEAIRLNDVSKSQAIPREGSGVLRPDVQALIVMPVVIQGRLESFFGFVDTTGPRRWEDEEFAILQIIVDSFARAVERRIAERERDLSEMALERAVSREREANRYKSEFLANMSHELRTPMNAIVGYAELLSRPNVDADKQGTWIKNIRRSTDHLLSLINDVLDLSKIEAGEMNIQRQPVAIADAVASVEEVLRGQANEKLIDFRITDDGTVPEVIETDPVRFKQVLINLVGNAIKFTNEGQVRVRISTRGAEEGSQGRLVVDVIDTGIGIDPEDLRRIFRPFSQARPTGDPRFGGTGLGLDISRQLSRLMGGSIEVESELGKGSTFTFELPMRGASARTLPTPFTGVGGRPALDEEPVSLEGRCILIVDDHRENREVLRFLLVEAGCLVDSAENGALGVKLVLEAERKEQPYDVVLMDMNMPVMDGYEATRSIVGAGVETPIIALTAYSMAGDEERCREAGCIDYVSKPVMPSSFLETIAGHLTERSRGPGAKEKPGMSPDSMSLVGNPRFEPLIRRYVTSFPDLVVDVRAHFAADRKQELQTCMHRLRGTAVSYGYPELSGAAGVCEDRMRSGAEALQVKQALEDVVRILERISAAAGA